MKKEIICTVCPRGCHVMVEKQPDDTLKLEGYGCKRGQEYAAAEFTHPVRILTTTVKMEGTQADLLPVRSSAPIPKEKIMDCMAVIRQAKAATPVARYDVVITNICGTGVDIVATKDVK